MSLLTGDDAGAIALSLRVAATAVAAELPLAVLAAYALSRSRLAARVVLETAVTLPLVLPPVATGYLLLVLFGHAWGRSGGLLAHAGIVLSFRWTGAALAAAVMAFPLMVRPMRLAMEAIEPEVDEAALTLGAPPLVRFFQPDPATCRARRRRRPGARLRQGARRRSAPPSPSWARSSAETLTLPTAIYQSTQSPGDEGHAAGASASSRQVSRSRLC